MLLRMQPTGWPRGTRSSLAAAMASAAVWQAAGFAGTASHGARLQGQEVSCLYAVLGLQRGATQSELKAAFRQRAKELHPDASPDADTTAPAFVQLLAAYKVLSNPRSRQLYDLSRDTSGPRVLRAAAASGVHGAADAAYEEAAVDLSWGLGRMFQDPPASGALDHMRQELKGELHSAVRRAYLGPKLRPEDLESGCLPDAFECDERATSDCPDLLLLLCGRQELGTVRERRAELLAQQQAAAAAVLHSGHSGHGGQQAVGSGQQAAVTAALHSELRVGGAVGMQGAAGAQAGSGRQEQDGAGKLGCHAAAQQQEAPETAAQAGGRQPEQQEQQPAGEHTMHRKVQHAHQAQQAQRAQQEPRDPDQLDLFVGGKLVASAVRHFSQPVGGHGSSSSSSSSSSGSTRSGEQLPAGREAGPRHQADQQQERQQQGWPHAQPGERGQQVKEAENGEHSQQQQQQQAQQEQAVPAEVIGVYSSAGELLAQVESQQLDPGSATASSARLLDARGRHTHTVYRSQTPLVRHLTFAAEAGATGLRTRRPSRLVVCRARRAWLPPSSLWLFKPLSYEHDVGGWYLEWAGEERADHPAVLHPAVCVLTAAFDSLDHERASRQPLGLFGRVRAAKVAAGSTDAAAGQQQQEQGWRGWLRSALRFHGVGRTGHKQ